MLPKKKKKLAVLKITSAPQEIFIPSIDIEESKSHCKQSVTSKQQIPAPEQRLEIPDCNQIQNLMPDLPAKNSTEIQSESDNVTNTVKVSESFIDSTSERNDKSDKSINNSLVEQNRQVDQSIPKIKRKSRKQMKIFDFGQITNLPKADTNEYYETVQNIFSFFNKRKSIPLILTVIHQSAGNLYEAIHRLAQEAYDFDENDYNFHFSSISAPQNDLEEYFQ